VQGLTAVFGISIISSGGGGGGGSSIAAAAAAAAAIASRAKPAAAAPGPIGWSAVSLFRAGEPLCGKWKIPMRRCDWSTTAAAAAVIIGSNCFAALRVRMICLATRSWKSAQLLH
jgi:hypothetical protein